MKRIVPIVLSGFGLLLLSCIPSEAPASKDGAAVPAVQMPDSSAEPTVAETETTSTDDGQTQVAITMPDNPLANAMVQVEKRDGGGFILRGNLGFSGVIRRLGNQWRMDARFRFPSPGYSVGDPTATAIGTMMLDEVGATLSTPVDQFMITIPVALPPEGTPASDATEDVPVTLEIDAPENADFIITLSQL